MFPPKAMKSTRFSFHFIFRTTKNFTTFKKYFSLVCGDNCPIISIFYEFYFQYISFWFCTFKDSLLLGRKKAIKIMSFFPPHPWHVGVPVPGIEPVPEVQPVMQLQQCCILNSLCPILLFSLLVWHTKTWELYLKG